MQMPSLSAGQHEPCYFTSWITQVRANTRSKLQHKGEQRKGPGEQQERELVMQELPGEH